VLVSDVTDRQKTNKYGKSQMKGRIFVIAVVLLILPDVPQVSKAVPPPVCRGK